MGSFLYRKGTWDSQGHSPGVLLGGGKVNPIVCDVVGFQMLVVKQNEAVEEDCTNSVVVTDGRVGPGCQ